MKIETIIQSIDQWGITDPTRIAYHEAEKDRTFGELKNASDALAVYLNEKVEDKAPIVVFGELEFEMLVGFLGASKSGHAYIPIESNTPKERIELILSVAQPAVILGIAPWPEITTSIPVIAAEELSEIFKGSSSRTQELTPVDAGENYYIIFTSGTTGVPKGVQISHDNLISFVEWALSDFSVTEGMRFLSQAPYSFDLSVMSIYPALVSGGSLVPMEKETINDFKKLFALLPQLELEVWVSTPSFMEICLMEPTFDSEHVPSLVNFLFCGEELTKKTAEQLLERFPQANIYNTYGPTEATVAISGVKVTEAVLTDFDRVPIGFVKEDTMVRIMDGETMVPAGEIGEIIIAGPSVSKGYMNNEEKTAAAFFELDGVPAYRTGDAGRLTNDGMLLYEGRIDFQVKMHGYRIELEDIDHHLSQLDLVKQATVVPKYKDHKVQQLVAYVVAEKNEFEKQFQLTKAIKEELGKTVMDYMVPQRFIYVEQLPRTANGKIDRKGLINEVNGA